eukprot:TRINITY_DN3034_c0_g1_i10.p1 TRINITY_DN3034_c0_g1~~TRINITY_DN3034_c0_g1_i10.p1  ORF type:complete len:236 (+),score=73.15 TRINITY_DN3034_c0_g1_i10:88-795(+)
MARGMACGMAQGKAQAWQQATWATAPKRSAQAAGLLAAALSILDQMETIQGRNASPWAAKTLPIKTCSEPKHPKQASMRSDEPRFIAPMKYTLERKYTASTDFSELSERSSFSEEDTYDSADPYMLSERPLPAGFTNGASTTLSAWPVSAGNMDFAANDQLFEKAQRFVEMHLHVLPPPGLLQQASSVEGFTLTDEFKVDWQSDEFKKAVALCMNMPPPPGLEMCMAPQNMTLLS